MVESVNEVCMLFAINKQPTLILSCLFNELIYDLLKLIFLSCDHIQTFFLRFGIICPGVTFCSKNPFYS